MALNFKDVLKKYQQEELPEFSGIDLKEVNQVGNFGNTPLHVAAIRGDIEEIQALIDGGADVNAVGEMKNQPIHDAIGQDNIEAVRLLVNAGVRLDGVNEFGLSPLQAAEKKGNQEIIKILKINS